MVDETTGSSANRGVSVLKALAARHCHLRTRYLPPEDQSPSAADVQLVAAQPEDAEAEAVGCAWQRRAQEFPVGSTIALCRSLAFSERVSVTL